MQAAAAPAGAEEKKEAKKEEKKQKKAEEAKKEKAAGAVEGAAVADTPHAATDTADGAGGSATAAPAAQVRDVIPGWLNVFQSVSSGRGPWFINTPSRNDVAHGIAVPTIRFSSSENCLVLQQPVEESVAPW